MTGRIARSSPVAGLAVALMFLLAACQYPRDPEGTLDRVRGGTMRVGVIGDPPWAEFREGQAIGVEPTLIRAFAAELDAEVEWIPASESELLAALSGFQLDVIVGGLDRSSQAAKEVALTRPYVDTNVEVGVPPGTELPDDLGGRRIWVEAGSEAAALLEQEEADAVPVFFEELSESTGRRCSTATTSTPSATGGPRTSCATTSTPWPCPWARTPASSSSSTFSSTAATRRRRCSPERRRVRRGRGEIRDGGGASR